MRRVLLLLLLLIPLARTAQADETADLIAILRALHADRCDTFSWRTPGDSMVVSDRPARPFINPKTKRPARIFDIELVPRSAPGTLWPRIVICPTVEVVDHVRLELMLMEPQGLPTDGDGFALAFGGASSYEVITLPAFSADGNRAVVIRTHECPLCGDSSYFELVRTKYGWRVARRQLIWIS